jgi:hypothetical protein
MELKEKLVAELKTKYQGQTTTKFIEGLADRLIGKVDKEEDIKGVIDELDNSPVKIADIQAEGDRRATELTQRIKELEKKAGETPPKVEPKPEKKDDDTLTRLEKIEKMLLEREQREESQKAMDQFKARIDALKIPRAMIEGIKVESTDAVEDHVSNVEKRYKDLVNQIKGPSGDDPPKKGDPAKEKQRVIEEIKKYSKNIK